MVPAPSTVSFELREIRANLLSIRSDASERLRGRELLKRADDAVCLLDRAERHRSPPGDRPGLGRLWRELLRPPESLDRSRMRWKVASMVVAMMLLGLPIAAYLLEVRSHEGLARIEDFLQSADALITVLVVIVAWSYSAWRFERQRRVETILESIDECRTLIQIVDAHALAKDFSQFWDPRRGTGGCGGMGSDLVRDDAIEYLAIATRIVKLTAQVASSYGSVLNDHAVVAAVDSVSQLALSIERNALAKQQLLWTTITEHAEHAKGHARGQTS